MADIEIPDFPFTARYYPEILEDLIQRRRNNTPELTDEDPTEPDVQLLRSVALAFHLNNCLLDLVANEMFLPTAKLRSSTRALLALIDVRLAQASPASVDILATLTTTFTTAKDTIPAGALFSTLETRAAQGVDYECLAVVNTGLRTDRIGYAYAFRDDTDVFTDHTLGAQGANFTPTWSTVIENGDALYFGHPGVLWDKLRLNIGIGQTGISIGVWEYFDGEYDHGVPSSVTNLGSTLRFNLNSILGSADRTGTLVRVRSALTGAYQDLVVVFAGGENRITTSGAGAFLGQAVPSTTTTDYIVGSAWRELTGLVDGSNGLAAVGSTDDVTYKLPQSVTQNWRKTELLKPDGTSAVPATPEAYWLRFRVIAATAATAPVFNEVRIHDGKQYQMFVVSQGQSRIDDPLGSSDGSGGQQFTLTSLPVVDDENIVITVDEGGADYVYARVDNFLNSVATDRHYTVTFEDDGSATITFGDGVNGKVPPSGVDNLKAEYRTMIDVDGNVGKDTITVNRSGIAYISRLTNPRGASGYAPREGSTDEDLARLKIAGPATLRTGLRAVSTGDVEVVATQYLAADGSRPVTRALAIEEAYGPKTVECVVVGAGGAQVDAAKLSEIETFFNGTEDERGTIVMNHQAAVANFAPQAIDVTCTVEGGNQTAVATALTALLNPLAKNGDGTWAWAFGGTVTRAKLYQVVMNTTPPPTNVVFATPAADVNLGTRSLPTVGTLTITVT